jgi:hypothetical protein
MIMIREMASTTDMNFYRLESCHSTWIFDQEHMRFRRVLKGLSLDTESATTAWRSYFGLEVDPVSESFLVMLNPQGTRLLRSWQHSACCSQCDAVSTVELSRHELQNVAS